MVPATRNNLAMTPWTAPMNRLEGLFDRLFDDGAFGFGFGLRADPAVVPISLWHDDDHIYVEAELPGMTEQDVEVTVHRDVLFIRGERKPEPGRQYLYNGRTWGHFERAITLPDEVDADGVQAELSHGVLRLTLPKSPETRPRKILLRTS
jgi:HSP20 family protein